MDFYDRLKAFIKHEGYKISVFERKLGFSNASLSNAIENKRSIGHDRLENIFSNFPDLNPTWLMLGKGTMLHSWSSIATVNDLRETIEVQKRVIDTQDKSLSELRKQLLAEQLRNKELEDQVNVKRNKLTKA